MKAWLKGGLTGLILGILFFVIFAGWKCDTTEMVGATGKCEFGLNFLFENFSNDITISISILVGFFIVGAIIGTVIGFLVNKFRFGNRKK